MRKALLLAVLPCFAACGPKVAYTDADVPKLAKLEDVMWAQSQAMDPQFKKMSQTAFTDDEFAALASAGARLKLTTARLKESFSKGDDWNKLADELATHGGELVEVATAKDAVKSAAALQATKSTCKACHSKYK
jgi:hypothetical protein